LATTRIEIDADEVQQLKALVAEQQLRLDDLEKHLEPPSDGGTKDKRATRRQLLKLAGATLAGAAGSAALRAIPASAADGNTVTVGGYFTETLGNATEIDARAATGGTAVMGLQSAGWGVWGYSKTGQGVHANALAGGTGLVAYSNGGSGTGVLTFGDGYGVHASGATGVAGFGTYSGVFGVGSPGVFGFSTVGNGVLGFSTAAYNRGVYAYTSGTYGIGIQARSLTGFGGAIRGAVGLLARGDTSTGTATYTFGYGSAALIAAALGGGPDALLNGTGRLVQFHGVPGAPYGAPNFSPNVGYFESVRATDGTLWVNGAATTGTSQSRWRRINAVRVDTSDGTGAAFKPVRVKDTRSGARPGAGTTNVVVTAPFGAGASAIPSDAVAIIGNLTAVNYTGGGYLAIMPAGASYTPGSDPSSVNFIVGQNAIANSFVVGLGTGTNAGKVQVYVAGHASHFIIDVTGYMQ
jgi:hypothetical protein